LSKKQKGLSFYEELNFSGIISYLLVAQRSSYVSFAHSMMAFDDRLVSYCHSVTTSELIYNKKNILNKLTQEIVKPM